MNEPISPRSGTKQALLADMMRVEGGASVRDLAQATGWQPNAIHSALATLRKQGCEIGVERTAAGNRYQIKAR